MVAAVIAAVATATAAAARKAVPMAMVGNAGVERQEAARVAWVVAT